MIKKIAVINLITALLLPCFSGCSVLSDVSPDDPFRVLYGSRFPAPGSLIRDSKKDFPSFSLSAYKMPVGTFFRVLSDHFNVGLVFSEVLQDKMISAEIKDSDLPSVLNVVSRQLSVDVVRVGNTFYIGALRPEDRGFFVRSLPGFTKDELASLGQSLISQSGKVSAVTDGLIVISDHESVISRVSEVFDQISRLDNQTYILQLLFVMLRKDALLESGLDVSTSGTISYNLSENSLDFKDFNIDALFNLVNSSQYFDLYSSPMFVLREGVPAVWKDGQKIPIPRRTVSSEGTVTTSGYDYIEPGFLVRAQISRFSSSGRLSVNIERSEVTGYQDYMPIIRQVSLNSSLDMVPFRLYLIGELSSFKVLDSQKNILSFGRDKGKSVIQVWAQFYRIGSAVRESPDRFPVVPGSVARDALPPLVNPFPKGLSVKK